MLKNIKILLKNFINVSTSYNGIKKYKHISILGIKINFRIRANNTVIRNYINKFKPQKYNDVNTKNGRKKVYLSIVSIFKNEPDLKEFIEYHKLVGVERFYLYDNGSTDCSKEILKPYIEGGLVVYNYIEGHELQYFAYRDAIFKFKNETEWLAIIDIDEFIVPIQKKDIKDVLREFENYPALGVNWVMFDSNGLENRPSDKLCIEAYTRVTANYQTRENRHIKSIVKPMLVKILNNPHNCLYKGNRLAVTENYEPIGKKDAYCDIKNAFTEYNSVKRIQINHYHTKSKEDYLMKIQRGFADHPTDFKRKFDNDMLNFKDETTNDYKIQKFLPELKNRMN